MDSRLRTLVGSLLLATTTIAGCAQSHPPRIHKGTACAHCGMAIEDLRFACAWDPRIGNAPSRGSEPVRVYDSIECLVSDVRRVDGASVTDAWLADYDQAALHRGDSLWVVAGAFPSPMGGGLAAFLDPAAAETLAVATRGRVHRLGNLIHARRPTTPPRPDSPPSERPR